MTGYKTNIGASMVAVGGVIVSMAEGCPKTEWVYWLKMGGSVLVALGGALSVYGLGDKMERGSKAASAERKKIQKEEG